jgi:hypothetical protein
VYLRSPEAFARHLKSACATEWVVYAKPPFNGPKQVLAYLARYTHRVAISNHRLLHVDDHAVCFRYKDYRSYRIRSIRLPLHEFARRFLLHVLPKGFVRIRYYGFLANAHRARLLSCSRLALGQDALVAPTPPHLGETDQGVVELLAQEIHTCPHCGKGVLRCIQVLGRPPPATAGYQRVAS